MKEHMNKALVHRGMEHLYLLQEETSPYCYSLQRWHKSYTEF